jgi:hypothetical protein
MFCRFRNWSGACADRAAIESRDVEKLLVLMRTDRADADMSDEISLQLRRGTCSYCPAVRKEGIRGCFWRPRSAQSEASVMY